MNRYISSCCLPLLLATLLIASCGARPDPSIGGNDEHPSTKISSGEAFVQQTDRDDAPAGTMNPLSDPGQVRVFLEVKDITHGDIYLQGGLLYINIVGLTEEIDHVLGRNTQSGRTRQ